MSQKIPHKEESLSLWNYIAKNNLKKEKDTTELKKNYVELLPSATFQTLGKSRLNGQTCGYIQYIKIKA